MYSNVVKTIFGDITPAQLPCLACRFSVTLYYVELMTLIPVFTPTKWRWAPMITCENANFIQLSGFSKLTKTIKTNVIYFSIFGKIFGWLKRLWKHVVSNVIKELFVCTHYIAKVRVVIHFWPQAYLWVLWVWVGTLVWMQVHNGVEFIKSFFIATSTYNFMIISYSI